MGTVTDYLATVQPPARRAALERVVRRAHELVPDLVEATAYGMPVLTHRGKGLLSAMATAKHLALYPHSGSVVALVAGELSDFSLSAGTIRFDVDKPIPDAVLDRVILARRDEIDTPKAKGSRR